MNAQLLERIKECPTLPSLPAIAVQVLELTHKADVDIAEIARLISKDPALSTKILKTVNSSFYGRPKAVGTISQALVILGLQSVKTLVLGFSLVSNLSKTKTKGFRHLAYWKRSIYAATAARVLSTKLGVVQHEEAFLCGLLADIGMLVLDQVIGEDYGRLHEVALSHSDLAEAERNEFGMTHADVGGVLAEQWKLPPVLCVPVARHHSISEVPDPSLRRLTHLVALSGRCADVFVDESAARAIVGVRQECQHSFKLSEQDCDALLAEIGRRTKEVAGLFEINIGGVQQYESILKKAQEALVELTLQAQMQATQLKQQNQQLKTAATTDGLTGLFNRTSFDDFLAVAAAEAAETGRPLSLIMADIDRFKSVNDKYGHPAGDAVIRAVARLVRAAARRDDLPARYGGEEMALVMPNTTRANAAAVAELLRRALEAKPVQAGSGSVRVTASFGVACMEPGSPIKAPAQLVKAADLALYHAKSGGRNQVKVYSPKPAAQAA